MSSNEELQSELDTLRDEVRQLRAALTQGVAKPPQENRLLSRRNLLRAAPVAAIGGALASLSASPAAAAVGNPVLQGQTNVAGAGKTTSLSGGTTAEASGDFAGVPSYVTPAFVVSGGINSDWAVAEQMTVGVSSPGAALSVDAGNPNLSVGAYFKGPTFIDPHAVGNQTAVIIENQGLGLALNITDGASGFEGGNPGDIDPSTGMTISTQTGHALDASSSATVLTATSTNTAATTDAVTVAYAGKGRGVYVESTNPANVNGTLTGVNDGAGIGVWGENKNTTASGIGVVGVGNKAGRGGRFAGGVANLQLTPGTAASHPSFTGHVGDLFVDSTGRLWYCQKTNTSTVAATWKQLA